MNSRRSPVSLWGKGISTAFIGAAILVGTGFAQPAVVYGAEKEWDIGMYDQCLKDNPGSHHQHFCCHSSGGQWDYDNGKCTAPPARTAADVMPQAPIGVYDQVPPESQGPQAPRPLPPVVVEGGAPPKKLPPSLPTVTSQPGMR